MCDQIRLTCDLLTRDTAQLPRQLSSAVLERATSHQCYLLIVTANPRSTKIMKSVLLRHLLQLLFEYWYLVDEYSVYIDSYIKEKVISLRYTGHHVPKPVT